ncbi:serine/threonine-protein kinase [Nocardia asteroides]|uniref:serine/threonine-protein kinase n=1 Tax=Nocardia asteroides TaxID=1824 RepID=UPI001E403A1F|nr:serine/threonine-protein kinase [Nocardia asteroides]UGT62969.1 protein kinase [Nocardia asteroides]
MTSDRLIAGRYRLSDPIGTGAMGVVWKATDVRLQRTVAVKQLRLDPQLTPSQRVEARARAMREGRIAARLHHPNAITVFDVAEEDGRPWLVMEFMDAPSLAARISGGRTLPPMEVARIGAQAAAALAAAHRAGILHRDVKPGNLLVGDDGTVKITDFGISRAVGDVTVTATGFLAGTPAYLAPEVARGEDGEPASDVFALGSTLYAAVTGSPPFGEGDNPLAVLHAVARGHVQPPQHAGALGPVLMHLLAPTPEARPTMQEAAGVLEGVAVGRPAGPTSVLPPGGYPRTAVLAGPSGTTVLPDPGRFGGPPPNDPRSAPPPGPRVNAFRPAYGPRAGAPGVYGPGTPGSGPVAPGSGPARVPQGPPSGPTGGSVAGARGAPGAESAPAPGSGERVELRKRDGSVAAGVASAAVAPNSGDGEGAAEDSGVAGSASPSDDASSAASSAAGSAAPNSDAVSAASDSGATAGPAEGGASGSGAAGKSAGDAASGAGAADDSSTPGDVLAGSAAAVGAASDGVSADAGAAAPSAGGPGAAGPSGTGPSGTGPSAAAPGAAGSGPSASGTASDSGPNPDPTTALPPAANDSPYTPDYAAFAAAARPTPVTPLEYTPPRRDPAAGKRLQLTALGAIALAVILLAGVLIALIARGTGDDDQQAAPPPPSPSAVTTQAPAPTTEAPAPATSNAPAPQNGPPTTEQQAQFVQGYYGMLPGDINGAWAQLSPGYQAQTGGFGAYSQFWSTIRGVRVGSITPTGPDTVVASLTYTLAGGGTSSESRWFRVANEGGRFLLAGSGL